MFESWEEKWIAGKYKKPVVITKKGDRFWLKFSYNESLLNEIKTSMDKRKWEPAPAKQWHFPDTPHNTFQMAYLRGDNPYEPFDRPLVNFVPTRECLRLHQIDMAAQILTRHYCLLACEMGTGKTLAAIEAMEASGIQDWLWVGPRSALHSVELEFKKWNAKVIPTFKTYSSLDRYTTEWKTGIPVHQGIVFDESHKLKTPTSQRSVAAMHLADAVRNEWGEEGYVILMSGSPAPKSPIDWYNQCETACPGYIKEGNIRVFKDRLGLFEESDGAYGPFPKLITWWDDENKCKKCGQVQSDYLHSNEAAFDGVGHLFQKSINEVENLYTRMRGLCLVKFKKDCLDLPEKQYQIVECPPNPSTLRAAKMIADTSPSAIKALTLLRELSDGFQYVEKEIGKEECPLCHGRKVYEMHNEEGIKGLTACPTCKGSGEVKSYERIAEHVPCPKEEALKNLLDQYEDVGRVVIYAGFTGSIERCVRIVQNEKWDYIRMDGTGVSSSIGGNAIGLLQEFQSGKTQRLAFIGNPGSAGTGLTLTASPCIIYYSNDFNADSRIQSEDRIHRMGMDTNRGATIYDLFHLPTDKYVLDNLNKKRSLQSMSLGDIQKCLL